MERDLLEMEGDLSGGLKVTLIRAPIGVHTHRVTFFRKTVSQRPRTQT